MPEQRDEDTGIVVTLGDAWKDVRVVGPIVTQTMVIRRRSWLRRLFAWPWEPWIAYEEHWTVTERWPERKPL